MSYDNLFLSSSPFVFETIVSSLDAEGIKTIIGTCRAFRDHIRTQLASHPGRDFSKTIAEKFTTYKWTDHNYDKSWLSPLRSLDFYDNGTYGYYLRWYDERSRD